MITQAHVHKTYQQIRIMAGCTLIVAPLAIVAVAWLQTPNVLPTLSHYYYFEEHPAIVRTMFTGFLILVGGTMMAYRGFDNKDNRIHNLAGIMAICVAIFPKRKDIATPACSEEFLSALHIPAAGTLFAMAALAVWYAGGTELRRHLAESEWRTLRNARWFALSTMAIGIAIYIAFLVFGKTFTLPPVGILIVEISGFLGFATHWLGMTYVISKANARRRTASAELTTETDSPISDHEKSKHVAVRSGTEKAPDEMQDFIIP